MGGERRRREEKCGTVTWEERGGGVAIHVRERHNRGTVTHSTNQSRFCNQCSITAMSTGTGNSQYTAIHCTGMSDVSCGMYSLTNVAILNSHMLLYTRN